METTPPVTSSGDDEIVQRLASDYAQYITPRTERDAAALDDSIEELLTKLDEYCGLVDLVRSDTTLCLHRTLPEIQKKSEAMQDVFERVDQLEVFVGMVKAQVATMEGLLDQAEAEMSSSTMKKFLSAVPFFGRKTQPKVERHLSKFEPPEIFKTEDYFPPVEAVAEAVEEAKCDNDIKDKDNVVSTKSDEAKEEGSSKEETVGKEESTEKNVSEESVANN